MNDPDIIELIKAAHAVIESENTLLAIWRDQVVVLCEYIHATNQDTSRCVECGEHWPCPMERLRRTVKTFLPHLYA